MKCKMRILEDLQQNLEEHLRMREILMNHHEEPPEMKDYRKELKVVKRTRLRSCKDLDEALRRDT